MKQISFRDLDQAGRARIVGARLQSIIVQKGWSIQEFSRRMKLSHGTCGKWVNGVALPSPDRIDSVANVLDSPELITFITRAWKRNCLICDIEYTANTAKGVKLYCSPSCKHVAKKLNYAPAKMAKKNPLEAEALLGRLVISEFCNDCSGGNGLCPDRECGLRPISPLPLASAAAISSRNSVEASKKHSPEKRSEASKMVWDRPGYAVRMSTEMRSRWCNLTDVQKRNHIEAITKGRWGNKDQRRTAKVKAVKKTKGRLAHQAATIKVLRKMNSDEIDQLGDALRETR
jgi:transcriptional regulator with XRE-family HTH domain